MSEPRVEGAPVLAEIPPQRNVGFAGVGRSLAQWIGRYVVAVIMIPVGVAAGTLGILENLWRDRRAR